MFRPHVLALLAATAPSVAAAAPSADAYVDGIMRRNLFDASIAERWGVADLPAVGGGGLRLLAVLVAEPHDHSRALIAVAPAPELPRTYAVGDRVGDRELVEVALDRVGLREGPDRVGYLWLDAPGDDDVGAGDGGTTDGATEVERLAPNRYAVPRALIDDLLANPARLASQARVTLVRAGEGRRGGVRLSAFRPDTILGRLGLRSGDVLHAAGGHPVDSAEAALRAYQALTATPTPTVCVELTRRGQPLELCYEIR